MKMNDSNFKAFRDDAEKALKEVATKYGVEIDTHTGRITYDTDSFTLTLKVVNEGGMEREYNHYVSLFPEYKGLTGMFDKTVKVDGKFFKIIGVNRSSKYDIVLQNEETNKVIRYKGSYVAQAIKDTK